jgi:hypothetical protein
VPSGKKESYVPNTNNAEFSRNAVKNENSRIHNVRKDALLACLGGIIDQKTRNITARLG